MKKIVALTLSPLFLFANPSEILKEEKAEEKAIQQQNLDYLFDSKFPLDDYTYKRKPNPNNVVEFEKNTNEAKNTQPTTPIENVDDLAKREAEMAKRLAELEKKAEVKKAPKPKPQTQPKKAVITPQQRMNNLLRDSILAERGAQEIYFSKGANPYGVDSFSNQENIDNATNEHKLFRMVRAGRLIPATLTTAISSDLAGLVSAQIEEDIYATMGRAVMIPRGSKAIGYYQSSNEVTGHARLQIEWREIITPQGVNILLTSAKTSDSMGRSGAEGNLNNRMWQRWGIPYTLSTLTNVLLLSIATRDNNSNSNQYSDSIYNQTQTDLSAIVQEILAQQKTIKPVVEIKAGSRIFIVPTHHIWFPKPKKNEIMTQYFK
ncbi:DNA type IV secretion system protein ComB10 [Helicobacter sp.]|uniref:DNA type IV secretion system protein ComB10 n=1 Tax=Helicobacter sp. TaxID=218 RepID=UPI0025C50A05|nr:DNA type IV secretion system protein ComB10 [Helicobacter sp.]MCI5632444.1 DNA type IV secretion system protein ComB10 [Helicobacter sp.]